MTALRIVDVLLYNCNLEPVFGQEASTFLMAHRAELTLDPAHRLALMFTGIVAS
jgi:hypothetical protein